MFVSKENVMTEISDWKDLTRKTMYKILWLSTNACLLVFHEAAEAFRKLVSSQHSELTADQRTMRTRSSIFPGFESTS